MAGIGALQMGAFTAGSLAGMAHDGMTSIPEDGTWLLKKNERVIDSKTNTDLKEYLKKDGNGKTVTVGAININGGNEESVLKALPELRKMMEDVINGNISSGGSIKRTIQAYA